MLNNKAKKNNDQLDEEIGSVLDALNGASTTDPEYPELLNHLEQLYKIKDATSKNRVSFDKWLPVLGSIGGVLIIVTYEALGHTVTSKALSFVTKPRV